MVKTDCSYFPLDRPCRFHKEKGIHCQVCPSYQPVHASRGTEYKILIIKLDAMGDVLRTTFLLPGLKKKYQHSKITWVVAPESRAILENNPFIQRVWTFDKSVFAKLLGEKFDVVINLDLSPLSLSLATMAQARARIGYWLDNKRKVCCSNAVAKQWLEMSAFDDKKKENEKTYQHWMSKIVGLPRADYEIYVPLARESVKKASLFAKKHSLGNHLVVGINPGAGGRWKLKKWTDAGYFSIMRWLAEKDAKILLLGGPQEGALLKKFAQRFRGKAVSTGTDNSILDFFALVNLCDIVIAGDTMALHAALGLKKKAVAIFGPTSWAEIEMYGRGEKVISSASCICCYRPECNVKPTCMEMIKPDVVRQAVETLL